MIYLFILNAWTLQFNVLIIKSFTFIFTLTNVSKFKIIHSSSLNLFSLYAKAFKDLNVVVSIINFNIKAYNVVANGVMIVISKAVYVNVIVRLSLFMRVNVAAFISDFNVNACNNFNVMFFIAN